MTEPKTRPTNASVDAFLALQPDQRRADCDAIVAMMRQATGEPSVMWGESIVGFGRYAQTRSGGKTYAWPVTGFSPRKNDLALYIVHGFDALDGLLARLGKHKASKACLYIKKLADIDRVVLEQIVVESVKAMEPLRMRDG